MNESKCSRALRNANILFCHGYSRGLGLGGHVTQWGVLFVKCYRGVTDLQHRSLRIPRSWLPKCHNTNIWHFKILGNFKMHMKVWNYTQLMTKFYKSVMNTKHQRISRKKTTMADAQFWAMRKEKSLAEFSCISINRIMTKAHHSGKVISRVVRAVPDQHHHHCWFSGQKSLLSLLFRTVVRLFQTTLANFLVSSLHLALLTLAVLILDQHSVTYICTQHDLPTSFP